ncbi:3-deoxy-D-manno-octulosonic acid transferase [Ruegeria sediminis]|uniref:3-deoxy-D-manno-octulosonic acid transferase n=1 Tax=Ruegeria sediminis TaxID=2583820 RepID=A0ABY2WUC6_9RHOB|nr:glycosyltransferase N-terminal domain-containing protein [Ruegeria sediminis]TMV04900.1 3-deoxy-D-manno-octulosonic acid transferase [Ruegeria sediminis]
MSRARSLSLAAYRVLSWRGQSRNSGYAVERPEGEVLWIHVSARDRLAPVEDLCRRLLPQRPGLAVFLTVPPGTEPATWGQSAHVLVSLPNDNASAVRGFLDHWRPDMGMWIGGGLLPNLITQAAERDIPLVLLEADIDVRIPRGRRWLPDIARYTLDCFQAILTSSEAKARQIRRLGIPFAKVSIAAPLQVSPNPRPWPEDELIETNHALAGRPVWLAAWVQDKEFISVVSAHRQALRLLHRLALIVHVADRNEAAPLRKRLEAMDLRCTDWDSDNQIEDATQVILSAYPEDLGLWYRVSPVTFLGSSLEADAEGENPMLATSLGSALIHGPNVRSYADLYARLDEVGAACTVQNAEELGDRVVELLAPDRAADMALAGWNLVTEGAQLTDQLSDMLQEHLDKRRVDHAGA